MAFFGCFVKNDLPKGAKVSDIVSYLPNLDEVIGEVPMEYVANGKYYDATVVAWLPSYNGQNNCTIDQIKQYLADHGLTAIGSIGLHNC